MRIIGSIGAPIGPHAPPWAPGAPHGVAKFCSTVYYIVLLHSFLHQFFHRFITQLFHFSCLNSFTVPSHCYLSSLLC